MTRLITPRVLVLIVLSAFIVGCGGGGGGGGGSSSTPTPSSSEWDTMKWDQDNWG